MYACWKCDWCSLLFSSVWKSFTLGAILKDKWFQMFWMDAIAVVWMLLVIFRMFSATNFMLKFSIQIIALRGHSFWRQKHFGFHVLLGIFRLFIISIIYLHKVFGYERLLTTLKHERNRNSSSIFEFISTRFPEDNSYFNLSY